MVKKPRLSLRDSGIGSYGIGTGMGCRIPGWETKFQYKAPHSELYSPVLRPLAVYLSTQCVVYQNIYNPR